MTGLTQAQLEEILETARAGMLKCLTAEEYQSGANISLRRARLQEYRDTIKWAEDKLAQIANAGVGGGNVNLAEFVRES